MRRNQPWCLKKRGQQIGGLRVSFEARGRRCFKENRTDLYQVLLRDQVKPKSCVNGLEVIDTFLELCQW